MTCLAGLVVAGGLAVVGGGAAVPDARITVDDVGVTPGDPVVVERTRLNVSVANSAGSPDAANVSEVRLLDEDGTLLDVSTAPGALSPGDALDTELWTRFQEPGEHRLTVEVVATEPVPDEADGDDGAETDGEAADPPVVRVERDVVVDVEPTVSVVDLRARALSPADLETDGDDEGVQVGGVDDVDGLLGGGGGLDVAEGESDPAATMDAPVAVTVVNTGTVAADRVSVNASSTESSSIEAGPFVVEDVAPGEERRVVVDLGSIDRRATVTFTATFRSSVGPPDDTGASRTATARLSYPPHEGRPVLTGANVTRAGGGEVVVDANVGNAGDAELSGVVVSVLDAPGVEATPAGEGYFVGSVASDDFVPLEIRTTANATVAETVPVRIAYTDRGIRYAETVELEMPEASGGGEDESAGGTVSVLGGIGGDRLRLGGLAVVVAFGFVAGGAALRYRRDV
ncbi:hypothetical protein ACFPM1_11040 [Halorubrum rubrum]|uniref:CARDB domain-containing protein n=1 Tax=Halorubrum rubrum TaxID=1126240 RepID=A0ABD5R340_9EURY|nr:hypothetical protein [Halorubrum rubrum]